MCEIEPKGLDQPGGLAICDAVLDVMEREGWTLQEAIEDVHGLEEWRDNEEEGA